MLPDNLRRGPDAALQDAMPVRGWTQAVVLAVLLLAPRSAGAQEKSGVRANAISVPSGPGTISGLGEQFIPNLNTGSGTFNVPLAVPTGTGELQPGLALRYDTGSGNGLIGLGWHLPIGRIQRQTERGTPTYLEGDRFQYNGRDLVPAEPDVFRLEMEGDFLRFRQSGDHWEAEAPDGTVYRFGVSEMGREVSPLVGATFGWALEQIVDVYGNRVLFQYRRDRGVLYPERIEYRPREGASHSFVYFDYEGRSDVFTDCRAGYCRSTALRLTGVRIESGGALLRRYELRYRPESRHSLLEEVTLIGRDDLSRLPSLRLSYSGFDGAPWSTHSIANAPAFSLFDSNTELSDFDGDSLPDLLRARAGIHEVSYNLGASWAAPRTLGSAPSVQLSSSGVQLADLDGNGIADLVTKLAPGAGDFAYLPNSGNGDWGALRRFSNNPPFSFEDDTVRLLDVDGDGLVDAMQTTTSAYYYWRNRGDGSWDEPFASPPIPEEAVSFADPQVRLADLNGDRLLDLCRMDAAGLRYWPSLGRGRWGGMVRVSGLPTSVDATRLQVGDLDGDGAADVALVLSDRVQVWMNAGGDRLSAPLTMSGTPDANPLTTRVRLVDIDGSGTVDVVWNTPSEPVAWRYVSFNGGQRANLLTRVENGLGKAITLHYEGSGALFRRAAVAGASWTTRLPFAVQVVTRMEVSDGRGWRSTQSLAYADGFYDSQTRQFRGFGRASRTEAGDETRPGVVHALFFDLGRDDEVRKGLVLASETADLAGRLIRRETHTYQVRSHLTGLDGRTVRSAERVRSVVEHHEKSASPAMTLEEWTYDDFGGVTLHRNWGVVEDADRLARRDETFTETEFAHDPARWLLRRPVVQRVRNAEGALLAETRYFYDGDPFVGLPSGVLGARGALTRTSRWVEGGRFAEIERVSRDAFGNVTATLDPNGTRREIEYDSETNRVPVRERIVLTPERSLELEAEYDPVSLAVTRFRDFGRRETRFAYDPFGRMVAIWRPGDDEGSPTQRFRYQVGNPLSRVISLASPDDGVVIEQHEFLDGLGRKVGVVGSSENGRTVVSGLVEFDPRGAVRREYDPTYSSGFDLPVPGGTFTEQRYDEVGRLVVKVFQDGTRREHRYRPLESEHWTAEDLNPDSPHFETPRVERVDALGTHTIIERLGTEAVTTRFVRDAMGRVAERVDAEGASSFFDYDGLGRLRRSSVPARGADTVEYDDAGNVVRRVDARGAGITFEYDAMNRVVLERTTSANGGEEDVVEYHYDETSPLFPKTSSAAGALAWVRDPSGEHHFAYDARGRIRSTLRRLGGQEFRFDERRDRLDRIVHTRYPNGREVEYRYGVRGLLQQVPGFIESIDYDARGQAVRTSWANGVTSIAEFDAVGRRNRLHVSNGSETFQELSYSHNPDGALVGVVDGHLPSGDLSATRSFQYDSLYRLIEASSPVASWSYRHDRTGNLLYKSDVGGYQYAAPHLATMAGGDVLEYDAAGNLIRRPGGTQRFDGRGRLSETVADDGTTIRWRYGYPGTLASLEQNGPLGSELTLYVDQRYEVRNGVQVAYILLGGQRVVELRGPPAATTELALQRFRFGFSALALVLLPAALGFVRRGRSQRTTRRAVAAALVLAMASISCGPGTSAAARGKFLHPDHLGSIAFTTDEKGAIGERTAHDPYGRAAVRTDTPYGFAGQESVQRAGLSVFAARAYDPRLGRFLSVDPAALIPDFGLDDSQLLSVYSYARSTPSFFVDVLGLAGTDYGWDAEQRAKAAYEASVPLSQRAAVERNTKALAQEAEWQNMYQKAPWYEQVIFELSEFTGGNDMARGFTGESERGAELSAWDRLKAGVTGVFTAGGWATTGTGVVKMGLKPGTACLAGSCGAPGACFPEGTEVIAGEGLVPIEAIELGDRVEAGNARCDSQGLPPGSVTVELDIRNDTHLDEPTRVRLVRPTGWAEALGLRRGPAWLELGELGASGWATLTRVGPAPEERPGNGCLVVGTISRFTDDIVELRLEGGAALEVTPSHPFYLERSGWTRAGELLPSDLLRTDSGPRRVLSIESRRVQARVYTLEVDLEHSYRVGSEGVWAHNMCGAAAGGGPRFFRGAKPGQAPSFTPRPNEFKVDPATGTVKPTHGVSVFDNPESVSRKGFVPHEVDQATVPGTLQIKQRGADPAHYEIMPAEGTHLTPEQFTTACQGIGCKR